MRVFGRVDFDVVDVESAHFFKVTMQCIHRNTTIRVARHDDDVLVFEYPGDSGVHDGEWQIVPGDGGEVLHVD